MSDKVKTTFVIFWTFAGTNSGRTYRADAMSVSEAILTSVGLIYMQEHRVKYLVFEVGGDERFYGTTLEAVEQFGFPEGSEVFYHGEMCRAGYDPEDLPALPDPRGDPNDDYEPVCFECGEDLCPDCVGFYPTETGVICTTCVNATV